MKFLKRTEGREVADARWGSSASARSVGASWKVSQEHDESRASKLRDVSAQGFGWHWCSVRIRIRRVLVLQLKRRDKG
jgi:hypothetical protein